MNQMLQEPELDSQVLESQVKDPPETIDLPPAPSHPRFAKPQRVAFVQSSWHREVVEECRIAFLAEIEARGIARAHIDLFEVSGSFEIPLHAQLLAKTRRYTAIVAAGLVVEGGAALNLTGSTVEKAGAVSPLSGCQGGVGIEVGDDSTSQVGHATLSRDTVESYQKNGITADSYTHLTLPTNHHV